VQHRNIGAGGIRKIEVFKMNIEVKPEKVKRWYDSVRWRKARAYFLSARPLCQMCERVNKATAASIVDHREPHGGDYEKFWDQSNWQALCAACHGVKRRQDHGGLLPGCDVNGMPIDPNHSWGKL